MGSHSVTFHPTQVNLPRLTPARQASTRFTYPRGMEGWVDLDDLLHTEMVYPPATSRPPLSVLQSSFLPFPLIYSLGLEDLQVWAEHAHPLTKNLKQFMQSNSVIQSTLMFNVLHSSQHLCLSICMYVCLSVCLSTGATTSDVYAVHSYNILWQVSLRTSTTG